MQSIIGIGNRILGDDGVGVYIVEQLSEGLKNDNVRTVKLETGGIDIIRYLKNSRRVWIIDACSFGHQPGTIGRYTLDSLPVQHKSQINCHSSMLEEIIKAGYNLYPDEMPEQIHFILIEGENLNSYSDKLSKPVLAAANEVIDQFFDMFKL
jgi:hydrogenase maturation protease